MARRYKVLDVFTDRVLAGNPLAVVLDAEGLDTAAMQAIAREFNLSETVFVSAPKAAASGDVTHRARLRIFTPGRELPFAGHPTVGTAVLLGLMDGDGMAEFILEEAVGPVHCSFARIGAEAGNARFALPRLPSAWGEGVGAAEAAAALSLDPAEIGFDAHRPSRFTGGVAYDLVPVASLEAVKRARPRGEAFDAAFGASDHPAAYVYARQTVGAGHHYHARMFAPGMGVAEDPATGSAVAAFAGAILAFERPGDGEHRFVIEQGYEMGRPSIIGLTLTLKGGALTAAAIDGGAVIVAEGTLHA